MSEINYRLLDKDGQPLSIGIETDSRNLSGVATCSGFNTYEVDVTQYGLPKGYYTVALYNSKNEEYLLKIQVQ